MPQLPFGPVDGPDEAEPARRGRARTVPVHPREDLHRLPQGHRAPAAEHVRRARMAVMVRVRLLPLWAALVLGAGFPASPAGALAQEASAPSPMQGVDSSRFLLLAHSVSAMQARASEFAASRDARPE